MMRILQANKNYPLSCGILLITGFRNDKNSFDDIMKDLTDLDGYANTFTRKIRRWDGAQQIYVLRDSEMQTEKAAFMMCSLNATQCKKWRVPLINLGYREVVDPLTNPNSGRKITIFVRTRKPRPAKAKKKEKKKE